MKKAVLSVIFLLGVIIFAASNPVFAAKKFVSKSSIPRARVSKGSIPVIVRYRSDHLGILLSFANFNGIDSATYSFTYSSNGNPQGAGGTIKSTSNSTSPRELLFGTCSTAVCTYHTGLTNARLVLTANFTNGRTATKVFRIKTYR